MCQTEENAMKSQKVIFQNHRIEHPRKAAYSEQSIASIHSFSMRVMSCNRRIYWLLSVSNSELGRRAAVYVIFEK